MWVNKTTTKLKKAFWIVNKIYKKKHMKLNDWLIDDLAKYSIRTNVT